MTDYSLVIAGLPVSFFDRLRKEAEQKIAPGGRLFITPNKWEGSYDPNHAEKIINQLFDYYIARQENKKIVTLLLYADYNDKSTDQLLERFFPFALPHRLTVPDVKSAKNAIEKNKILNDFTSNVIKASKRLRDVSSRVTHKTNVHNLNPLLLPVRNFQGDDLRHMLKNLYEKVTYCADPDELLSDAIANFIAKHPWKTPPDEQKRALCDGVHFFKSPGNDRHGYLRNSSAKQHSVECLLNARSRLGGAYDHCFHYDCTPVKGKLRPLYHNCHGDGSPPKKTHVNIAPNDYVIGH